MTIIEFCNEVGLAFLPGVRVLAKDGRMGVVSKLNGGAFRSFTVQWESGGHSSFWISATGGDLTCGDDIEVLTEVKVSKN